MTAHDIPEPARLHTDAVVVDGLQINNWSREVFEELRTGGVSGVNATAAVWEGTDQTLRTVAEWYQMAQRHNDLMLLAETADDIRKAKDEGRVAVMLGFQNTSPFGDDYRLVEVFSRLGVRIAQLTYNIQNAVGGSCYEPEDSGLTRFGRNIVAEMNRVGMLIDLSHVGNRTSLDAVEASVAPVAITHSNPTWFVDNPRNKPAEVLRAVAEGGGVVGCCLYPLVLGGAGTGLDEFCAMVRRLVDEIGPEHVALGSDCTRNWDDGYVEWLRSGHWRPRGEVPATWPEWPHWFRGPEDFPRVTDGLVAAGLDEHTVRGVLGENWLGLFDDVFLGGRAA
ncbi:membrane dipeptidase [Nocardioides panzhihuensis]|uniref:Membrane dipeptidase n=1 Tax=Nocardioides panzhihuensis TaxID=860243 RepID=A0A7Z0IST4_9ACTN|nr:membrane dipeptidase [Nocardioides panzhihuensis]NYI78439.1 membrane dipeptidase [Nocardioides panzhihuensis]